MRSRVATMLVCLLGSAAVGACFLSDLFGTAGHSQVVFQWTGNSDIRSGEATPIHVSLVINGLPVSEPPVELAIPDTTIVRFRTTQDTIIGCRSGTGNVVARVTSSLSPSIDSVFTIHVSGGPANPPCP